MSGEERDDTGATPEPGQGPPAEASAEPAPPAEAPSHPTPRAAGPTVVVDVGRGERPAPAAAKAAPRPSAVEVVEEDFGALLAELGGGVTASRSFSPGDKVAGWVEVISLDGDEIFLDLGGKATGYVLKSELLDAEGRVTVRQGDKVEGVVVGTDANGVRIQTSVGRLHGDRQALLDAFEAGLPVEGKVTGVNKGGFEVQVAGGRAFCPMSQMELFRPPEPAQYVGRSYAFKVTEVKGGEAVLSRRQLLEEERKRQAAELRERIEPGARLTGTVRSLQPFGVFVDLGGLDGLVPMSELAWGHVADAHEVVKLGQQVEVIVLEVDEKRDKLTLSLRKAQGDPFDDALERIRVGDVVEGTVARLTTFGAFVHLAPEVDGLVHVSDMAHYHVRSPKEILSEGDQVRVKVTAIDVERRRISLSLKALAEDPWDGIEARYQPGAAVTGRVARVADFGVFVELEPGVTALLPASESGVPHGQPLGAAFRVGRDVEAKVLRVEPEERRLALTVRDEADRDAGADRRGPPGGRGPRDDRRGPPGGRGPRGEGRGPQTWTDRPERTKAPDGKAIGSFGELLLKALGEDGKEGS